MPNLLVRGLSLHYSDEGTGEPVLLIHGLGNSSQDWEFHVPGLVAAGYRVICPDLLGFGHSGRPDSGYSPSDLAADLRVLLSALKISQAHIVGYSMGGAVAYQLAVSEPELCLSLGIVSSLPCFVPQRLQDHWQFWLRRILSRMYGMEKLADKTAQALFPHRPDLIELMRPRYADNDVAVYSHVLAGLASWDVREQLHRIRCPVLIMAAETDYFRLEDVQQSVSLLPTAELEVVPDTRHGLPLEQPERVVQSLLKLFSRSKMA